MTFWDFSAPFYDIAEATNGKAYGGMLKLIHRLVPEGARVLELAAGTGAISLAVADNAADVVCTDISERMLSIAKRKAARRGIANVIFQPCDIFKTSFADNEFDVVIASQVLHLLDEPERAAAELKRISRSMVIAPVCLLKNINAVARVKVGFWRLLGFAPKNEFDAESYREFLTRIGLTPVYYEIADGAMPLAVAVWRI
jgi:ubiquinone/menaquinone biosynthesis C-methylase UbiE